MANTRKDSILGRKIAVLVADHVDKASLAVCKALEAEDAVIKFIAPRLGDIKNSAEEFIKVNHSLPTVGSVMFDAVFIPGGQQSVEALCEDAHAVLFVKEAYKHGKAIAAHHNGAKLIAQAARSAGIESGEFHGPGVITSLSETIDDSFVKNFISAIAMHRCTERPDLDAIVA
ncbi:MAG: DJ-1/PfpI family protein [Methylobacter sp.]|nr:DJ-1/PfpI family protein [Methylobacter sp.]